MNTEQKNKKRETEIGKLLRWNVNEYGSGFDIEQREDGYVGAEVLLDVQTALININDTIKAMRKLGMQPTGLIDAIYKLKRLQKRLKRE